MDRRAFLGTAAAAAVIGGSAAAQPQADPFGLRAIIGPAEGFWEPDRVEQALTRTGQRSILKPTDTVARPTFRLTKWLYSAVAVARVEWEPVGLSAQAHIWMPRVRAADQVDYMEISMGFDVRDGMALRTQLDDQERFWDSRPLGQLPPFEDDGPPALCHVGLTLEARIGRRRHAIFRPCAGADTAIARFARTVFGSGPVLYPSAPSR